MLLAETSFSYSFNPEVWLLVAFCIWLGFYVSRVLGPRWLKQQRQAAATDDSTAAPTPLITQRQKHLYIAAVFFLWLASDWPLHELSEDHLYAVHMIQHMLITLVVPPLLLLATPEPLATAAFGQHNKILRRLTHPVVAGVAFNIAVATTHLTWVVNNSTSNGAFHYSVHLLLFALALLMWMPVCGPLPEFRLRRPGQMVYLFTMSILPTVPAGFLTFAENPIYDAYTGAFGISATSDQQAAGLIMKVVGGLYLWAIIAVLFFKWSAQQQYQDFRTRRRVLQDA